MTSPQSGQGSLLGRFLDSKESSEREVLQAPVQLWLGDAHALSPLGVRPVPERGVTVHRNHTVSHQPCAGAAAAQLGLFTAVATVIGCVHMGVGRSPAQVLCTSVCQSHNSVNPDLAHLGVSSSLLWLPAVPSGTSGVPGAQAQDDRCRPVMGRSEPRFPAVRPSNPCTNAAAHCNMMSRW